MLVFRLLKSCVRQTSHKTTHVRQASPEISLSRPKPIIEFINSIAVQCFDTNDQPLELFKRGSVFAKSIRVQQ